MKKLVRIVSLLALLSYAVAAGGCVILEAKKLPPGQEKKIEGDQSAKKHAPGQEKKDKS